MYIPTYCINYFIGLFKIVIVYLFNNGIYTFIGKNRKRNKIYLIIAANVPVKVCPGQIGLINCAIIINSTVDNRPI